MFLRTLGLLALALSAGVTAFADFSYTTTTKTTGGSMAAMAGTAADRTGKAYFKGDKMMMVSGDTATIIDFGAQTVTSINNAQKSYTVKKFSDIGAGAGMNMDVSVDVKETGNKKTVNGFNASETVVTMNMDMDAGRGGAPMKMQMEMHMWVSPDVPGAGEVRAFYRKNAANFPWAAMMGNSGNQSMQKAMAQIQRKMAEIDGTVVEQVVRVMPAAGAGAPQMPQMSADQQAQIQAAMAKMQQMQQQGGQNAQSSAAMQQAMAAMGAMGRGGAPGSAAGNSAGGAIMEITTDSSGFSPGGVPDSVFAIPAGYKAK